MKIILMLILIASVSVSCSRKKTKAVTDNTAASTADSKDKSLEDDFIVDEEDQVVKEKKDGAHEVSSTENDSIMEDNGSSEEQISLTGGSTGTYSVQAGDTLMMVAFKIYGDYSKWKELSAANGGVTSVSKGQTLSYIMPNQKFNWQPEGLAYLIQRNDTLGTISNDKYGTPKKWKYIYENNKPLIKNPNLIFAGFTIYYKELANIANN